MADAPTSSQAALINLSFLAAVAVQNPGLLQAMESWMEKIGPPLGFDPEEIQHAKKMIYEIRRVTNMRPI